MRGLRSPGAAARHGGRTGEPTLFCRSWAGVWGWATGTCSGAEGRAARRLPVAAPGPAARRAGVCAAPAARASAEGAG